MPNAARTAIFLGFSILPDGCNDCWIGTTAMQLSLRLQAARRHRHCIMPQHCQHNFQEKGCLQIEQTAGGQDRWALWPFACRAASSKRHPQTCPRCVPEIFQQSRGRFGMRHAEASLAANTPLLQSFCMLPNSICHRLALGHC